MADKVDRFQALIAKWRKDSMCDDGLHICTEAGKADCADELEAALALPAEPPILACYAYRYPNGIRFDTGGRSINGCEPTETIPVYFIPAMPAASATPAPSEVAKKARCKSRYEDGTRCELKEGHVGGPLEGKHFGGMYIWP